MSDQINYDDLAPQDSHFTFRGTNYTLREPSEEAALSFRQWQLRGAKVVDGKMHTDVERVYEGQSILVSKSLFKTVAKGSETVEQPVPLAEVRALPSRIVKNLFERAKTMGELNEDETEEGLEKQIKALEKRLTELRESKAALKNESGGGQVTSISPTA